MRALADSRRVNRAIATVGWLAVGVLCATAALEQSDQPSKGSTSDESAQNAKDEQKSSGSHTSKLRIVVTSKGGKPVANASVYVRYNASGGFLHHDKLEEMDLKTNQDGSVKVPGVPQGKVLIQVVAKNWHTYGKWFDIEKDEETISVQLEPPPHWY